MMRSAAGPPTTRKIVGMMHNISGMVILTGSPLARAPVPNSPSLRNPAAAGKVFANVLLGFALVEAVALYALVIAMLELFVF